MSTQDYPGEPNCSLTQVECEVKLNHTSDIYLVLIIREKLCCPHVQLKPLTLR